MSAALPDGVPAPPDGALPATALAEAEKRDFGVYVHVPFCVTRCGYCDFTTYTAEELGPPDHRVSRYGYVDTVMSELRFARSVLGGGLPPASSVFFGGGTPTLLPADHLGSVVREIAEQFGFTPDVEITAEANPESVTPAYLARLRERGINRLSIGMQSVIPHVLATLDRKHRPHRPEQVVSEARAAGFDQISLDLIYGTPHETDADWQASLDAAIGTGADHVSAYALVVEPGTKLARQVARGEVPAPDDDVLADRYVQADETLARAGFAWYEISNWARDAAARCRHNQLYWRDGTWWGAGPGAHSHVGTVRWWNVRHPADYTQRVDAGQSPAAGREILAPQARLTETVMLGVRLREGIELPSLPVAARVKAAQMVEWGLIDAPGWRQQKVVLTQRGRLLADAVVRDLLTA